MQVVYAGENAPNTITKSIFLAGPTPRNKEEVESWRPDALKILEDKGFTGTVFVPEPRDGKFKSAYDDQVEWEEKYLNMADCIVFWVPRDLTPDSTGFPKMAAFTTNVEFGAWADTGKIVFGAPEKADKNTYLKYYADKYKVPTAETLTETLDNAIEMLGDGAERSEGECYVPLLVWNTPSFQSWYQSQKEAGNKLIDAKLLYTFRPGFKKFVFLWILQVNVYITSEDRNKTNEFVLARPDISSVCLYHFTNTGSFMETEFVLVKEFRSPASTPDGFIYELPSGSSNSEYPEETAVEEVFEETGFRMDISRLENITSRQLCGTLSSHKSHVYSYRLNKEELEWLKSQKGVSYGKTEDTEKTYIEIHSLSDILKNQTIDWSNLGMIYQALSDKLDR